MSDFVDARGSRCPWPVLRLARAMRSAGSVTIIADDPAAPAEIAALATAQGWIISVQDGAILVTRPEPAKN